MERDAHEHERLVGRGHRADGRRPETLETGVVVLMTQRSQVQILPPLPGQRPLPIMEGAFACPL